jgi:hypothetical protein
MWQHRSVDCDYARRPTVVDQRGSMPHYSPRELKQLADSVSRSAPGPVAKGKAEVDYRRAQESVVDARHRASITQVLPPRSAR